MCELFLDLRGLRKFKSARVIEFDSVNIEADGFELLYSYNGFLVEA